MLNRFRRFGFRLLYNECAFSYDLVSQLVSLGRWRSWQRSVIPYLPPPEAGIVLELAQGTGDLQLDLAASGYRAIALDLSASMGRIAQRKLAQAGLSAPLLRGEAGRLPIRSASIAGIVCTFPTAFIVDALTLTEIQRVLQREAPAVIVLSGLLTSGWSARLIRILYRLAGQAYRESSEAELHLIFQAQGMSAESHTLTVDGSSAQLLLLTKSADTIRDAQDQRLELPENI